MPREDKHPCKHLYGVIEEAKKKDFGPIGIGESQDMVYTINHQGLAAVVSDLQAVDYNTLPREILVRYLAGHQFVIEQAMKSYTVIPVKFGTTAENQEEAGRILARGHDQFKDAIEALNDKIELDVVATWSNFDAVLKEIGGEDKIKRFKAEVAGKPPGEFEAARIEVGKMVKSVLDDRRENAASEIVDELKEVAVDYWPHEVADDTMIINVAFLILRETEKEFDQKVNQLNERYQEKVNFRCVGPLPPYSFATMEVKRMDFEEVDAARVLLGLGEEATVPEIKESYRELAHQFHPDQRPGDAEAQEHFEKIVKAYRLLLDYCQQERCSFTKEAVEDFMLIRRLEI